VDAGQDAVLAELRARVADQGERIAFLERLTEHQAGLIADYVRRVAELPAGRDTGQPSAPAAVPEASPTPRRAPWWRFWQ
jgi:hypothetical protein